MTSTEARTRPGAADGAGGAGELERLRAERDHVIAALVEAHDQLAALGALLQVPTETLDEQQVHDHMLAEALELTGSDEVRLGGGDGERTARRPGSPPVAAGDGPCRVGVDVPGTPGHRLTFARTRGPAYTTGDLRMIETVAAAAGTLERLTRLHRDGLRRAAVEREHRLASELAQAALPTAVPRLPGLDVFARCQQADLTGGDLLVLHRDGDVLWFAVGDVVGKGLPAAMTMTRAVSALRVAFLTHSPDDPGAVVAAVGAALEDYLDEVDLFLTAAVGSVRPGGPVRLCNAGHYPVLYRPPGDGAAAPQVLSPGCPPLGLPLGRPPAVELAFAEGALLVLGSDGLAEQPDPFGVQFGRERLLGACAGAGRTAAGIGAGLFDLVTAHAAGTTASDDRTALVLRPTGAPAGRGPR
jgi:serine phosphatase RsbU (regulator of sigma subunit)